MIKDTILFGFMPILFVVAVCWWYSIEKKIKKNIDDMDL